jgi:hypothetical protein
MPRRKSRPPRQPKNDGTCRGDGYPSVAADPMLSWSKGTSLSGVVQGPALSGRSVPCRSVSWNDRSVQAPRTAVNESGGGGRRVLIPDG